MIVPSIYKPYTSNLQELPIGSGEGAVNDESSAKGGLFLLGHWVSASMMAKSLRQLGPVLGSKPTRRKEGRLALSCPMLRGQQIVHDFSFGNHSLVMIRKVHRERVCRTFADVRQV